VQPIFQNPFEAFSRYRQVDAYLFETAMRVAGCGRAEAQAAVAAALVLLSYRTLQMLA